MGDKKTKFAVLLKKVGDEQPALDRASQYAKFASEIEVVAIRIINEFSEENKEQLAASAQRQFDECAKKCCNIENLSLKIIFDRDVSDAFNRECASGDYDLAIISANRRNSLKDLFINTIDSQIIRCCPLPLLVVKDANSTATLGTAILIAIDFGEANHLEELDERLVLSAKLFAERFNGEVHIANCVSPLNRGLASRSTALSKIVIAGALGRKDVHQMVVDDFATQHGIPLENVHVLEGRIDEEIPRLCEKLQVRMVCMGTTPKSSFFGAIDSTASELVLEQIKGDVYIVNSANLEKEEDVIQKGE